MTKARVLSNISHDGVRYKRGDVFEGDDTTVDKLVAAGAVQDPKAPVDVATKSVDAEAEASKIVDDAKATADKIVAEAKEAAAKVTEAAKAEADQVLTDAKAEADKIVAEAKAAGGDDATNTDTPAAKKGSTK